MNHPSPEPHNFFMKQNISIQDAIDNGKPLPPWKQKLVNDLKGNIRSSAITVEGVNDIPTIPVVVKREKDNRKYLRPVLVLMLVLHWVSVLITNIFDLISDAIGEITINLTNFIRYNAQTEPTVEQSTD